MAGAALIEAIAKRPEEARSAVVPLSRVACMGLVRLLKGEGVVLLPVVKRDLNAGWPTTVDPRLRALAAEPSEKAGRRAC